MKIEIETNDPRGYCTIALSDNDLSSKLISLKLEIRANGDAFLETERFQTDANGNPLIVGDRENRHIAVDRSTHTGLVRIEGTLLKQGDSNAS